VKPQTLAVLIILYALAGSLLAFATTGAPQGILAAITGVGVALALGAAWPIHRGFPIAGVLVGLTLGSAFLLYMLIWLALYDHPYIDRPGILAASWPFSLMIYGAWTFLLTLGAAVSWLIGSVLPRPTGVTASTQG